MTRARPLGSAHRGTTTFLLQRLTSIYLGGFVVYFVLYLILRPIENYAAWSGYMAADGVRLAWALFVASLLIHIWTGLRSIYMDYLKPTWVSFTVSTFTAFLLVALAVWAAQILIVGPA